METMIDGKEVKAKCYYAYGKDCFAHRRGRCIILHDTGFSGRMCPFFKTPEEFAEGRRQAAERLRSLTAPRG